MNKLKLVYKIFIKNLNLRSIMCGILILIFAWYKLTNPADDRYNTHTQNIYFQTVLNVAVLIIISILLSKISPILRERKKGLILTISFHILMAIPLGILFFKIYVFIGLINETITNIPFFFFSTSFSQILTSIKIYSLITGYISLFTALFTVFGMYQYGVVRTSVVFHAIVNMAFVGTLLVYFELRGNSPSLIEFSYQTLLVCSTAVSVSIFFPLIIRFIKNNKKCD